MATTNADKNPCVDDNDAHFFLDKFMPISDYCKHKHRLLSFIYTYGNKNLLINGACAVKASIENMTDESLKGKCMIYCANSEGGKWYVR